MDIAVETKALRRVYRTRSQEVIALDGVDLQVRRGERFGVLGPNGAGKTTLIKILVTLLLPSSGEAFVDGLDVVRQFREVRHRIAMVSGGENVGFGMLKVKEQLWMFSQFYGMPSGAARRRIDELLERLNLTEAANRLVSALSSGMRQKMNLIRGLMTDPRILFLDEPTVALDVSAARDVRNEVRRWMAEDPTRTVILTTHYMMEADELKQVDLLVEKGLYPSREAFLQSAAHNLLREHEVDVRQGTTAATGHLTVAGLAMHNRKSLEKLRTAGRQVELNVTGIFRIADDVTPELACAVIKSLKVCGRFQASPEVKAALMDRTH